jgi:hypothetical protein
MEARLKKLERMNRVLWLGLGLAVLPWVLGATDKAQDVIEGKKGKFESIEIRKVIVVDDAGNQVGFFTGDKKGSQLVVRDEKGTNRLLVGMSEGNPSLLFANKKGNIVASYVAVTLRGEDDDALEAEVRE